MSVLVASASSVHGQTETETTIRAVFEEAFASYWRAGDAEGLASLWRDDGDWMSVVGSRRVVAGRARIQEVWTVGLEGRDTPAERAIDVDVDAVRRLSSDWAQVDMVLTFGDASTGRIREAMTAVLSRDGTSWRIVTCRVARLEAAE